MYIRGSYKEPLKKEVSYPGTEEECNSKMNILMVIFCKVIQALYLFILISKKHVGLTGLYFCKIQYKMSLDQEWVLSIMPKCSVERTNSDTTKKKNIQAFFLHMSTTSFHYLSFSYSTSRYTYSVTR